MTTPSLRALPRPTNSTPQSAHCTCPTATPTRIRSRKSTTILDQSRALQAYLLAIPIVNQAGMRDSMRRFGPDNQTDVIWEKLVDSKTVELNSQRQHRFIVHLARHP